MPTIELKNIGKNEKTSIADLIKKVIAEINKTVIPVVKTEVADKGNVLKLTEKELKETRKNNWWTKKNVQ
ncbi:MAG: hypothetical protein U9O87_09345 [Verrucomicrobiota bacterium]|nr:hypothetical protein [Verrucomicrobiota bacterium]